MHYISTDVYYFVLPIAAHSERQIGMFFQVASVRTYLVGGTYVPSRYVVGYDRLNRKMVDSTKTNLEWKFFHRNESKSSFVCVESDY